MYVADREQLVTDTFVELADTLAGDFDVSEFLGMLVDRCAKILGASTGGVALENASGLLQLAAANSEEMEALEQAEIDHEEGPCLDAYRHCRQVLAPDLRECRDRWPRVVARALDIGLVAACAFPLRVGGDVIGALNLYRVAPGEFRDEDVRLAQAFADVAAIGILQERRVINAERRAEQLQHALDSRVVIEQAKGVLAGAVQVSMADAFEAIRRHARTNNLTVRVVAQTVVDEGASAISH